MAGLQSYNPSTLSYVFEALKQPSLLFSSYFLLPKSNGVVPCGMVKSPRLTVFISQFALARFANVTNAPSKFIFINI
jgi:hypothetical protein